MTTKRRMTAREWVALRHRATVRQLEASPNAYDRTFARYVSPPPISPPFVPPKAGDWIHEGGLSRRWHQATGDLAWQPRWNHPSARTRCGFRTSGGGLTLLVSAERPADACRRCAGAAR